MNKFSDFGDTSSALDGEKLNIEEVIDREIIINDFRIRKSKFERGSGKYLTIQFILNDKKHVLFTGSEVLTDQLEKYKEKLPFIAVIKKVKKFYTLT